MSTYTLQIPEELQRPLLEAARTLQDQGRSVSTELMPALHAVIARHGNLPQGGMQSESRIARTRAENGAAHTSLSAAKFDSVRGPTTDRGPVTHSEPRRNWRIYSTY